VSNRYATRRPEDPADSTAAADYLAAVRLFKLDGVDERLELLPMAARRALDAAGVKLSLASWQRQGLDFRERLVDLGGADRVDVAEVQALLEPLRAEIRSVEPVGDPDSKAVPQPIVEAFGSERPIPGASWAALTPLERYVLAKVAERGRPERLDEAHAELVGHSALSSHLEPQGGVRMVNVGEKAVNKRVAIVESWVVMNVEAFERLATHRVPKGDVFGTARVAGIMAAKRTSEWIPLCHPLRLTRVAIELELVERRHAVRILATVEARDRTGVEMEALVAASTAALTVYDMLKSFDRGMQIGPTRLLQKTGGRSGDFVAEQG
jgi:cyclic pyranopterin phosphate synthase